MPAADNSAKELRLAIVCYGGVSLAIYMHGITKELHKLARASRKFDQRGSASDGGNPFADYGSADSEYAYFEELRDLAEHGARLSVAIDVIAGTSAGGINGVCLAKALAHDGDQRKLKKLWIEEGDMKRLIDALPVGGWRTRALLAAARMIPYPVTTRFPLLGKRMSRLLFDAITDMEGPAGRSLVPPDGSLDLYVTTTDLNGFNVLVPSGAGGPSQRDADHAQVMRFQYATSAKEKDGGVDNFTPPYTGSLAFAARATSCVPGAFPPVSLASFQVELDSDGTHRSFESNNLRPLFQRPYSESGDNPEDAWFVDGGVLDNAPFDLVVDAIAHKRAQTQVIRRLVYIQPDPGPPLRLSAHKKNKAKQGTDDAPEWLPSLWTALGSVKGSHPILRDLVRLRDLNLRIDEVSVISSAQMAQVLAILNSAADGTDDREAWDEMTFDELKILAGDLNREAEKLVGAYYPTYCRLKLEAAGSALADEISNLFSYPPDSTHQSFLRAILSAWGQQLPDWSKADLTAIRDRLGPADMPYRERRLLFILAGINSLYDAAGRQDAPTADKLNELKASAWNMLDEVRAAPRKAAAAVGHELSAFLAAEQLGDHVYDSPEWFAKQHEPALAELFKAYSTQLGQLLTDKSKPMWEEFQTTTANWAPEHRRALLSRYVGFPLWDALIFPTIALSDLPQFTPIGVSQYSPVAAEALIPPDGRKLKGTAWHHFGGFMKASWRENDYLWGRLDGAELILRTLRAAARPDIPEPTTARQLGPAAAVAAAGPRLKDAAERILAAEQDLRTVTGLRKSLAKQLGEDRFADSAP
jgi:patatin-related protein